MRVGGRGIIARGGEKNRGTMYLGYVKKKKEEKERRETSFSQAVGEKKMLRTIISVIIRGVIFL